MATWMQSHVHCLKTLVSYILPGVSAGREVSLVPVTPAWPKQPIFEVHPYVYLSAVHSFPGYYSGI